MNRRRWALVVGGFVMSSLFLSADLKPQPAETTTLHMEARRLAPWQIRGRVDLSDRILPLEILGTACYSSDGTTSMTKLSRVTVRESASTIEVAASVVDVTRDGECGDVGIRIPRLVTLEAPLANRSLIDSACSLIRYAAYVACTEPKVRPR